MRRRGSCWWAGGPTLCVLASTLASALASSLSCSSEPSADELGSTQLALTLPANFSDALVATVPSPTALAFTPDGRLLITTQTGQLRIVQNGTLSSTAALNLSATICTNSERGVLGVAVDPGFANNYTFRKHGVCTNNASTSPVNRVSRFTLADNNTVAPSSELVLIDNVRSPAGNHNAGDLQFGKDGYLYVSIGDGGCDYADASRCAGSNDAARDNHMLLGKIVRIRTDGSAPPGNPYLGSDSDVCRLNGGTTAGRRCRETYASGLRNPFRIAFDPNATGTRFFINDVGQNVWEEIDQGQAGADYGWNVREGHCANGSTTNCGTVAGFVNPIYDYGRSTGCASITGGAFVPNGLWPSTYDNGYLFADYVCGRIFLLKQSGSTWQRTDFATAAGSSSVVAMTFGPHQGGRALFYTTYASGGQVRRITFASPTNQPPVAVASATPRSGPVPLAVSFDGSQSSDPNPGDTLTYSWNFGDGTPLGSGVSPTHSYASAGVYNATLTVRDQLGAASPPVSVQIQPGNTPPVPTISAPAAGALFRVGQTLTLSGAASDAQDGTLPATALSWSVLQHHNTHTHPYLSPTSGNNLTITAPPPEDLAATETSYLEVQLTATDSQGLRATTTRIVEPRTVDITLASAPSGRTLTVNGSSIVAPTTLVSWDGYALNVNAPAQSGFSFVSWSDGGAQAHTITTPATATTYTATFSAAAPTRLINFQPAGSPVPAGYLADTGAIFGNRGNGQSYGWNLNNAATARDRNAANSADQRYDTLQHLQKPENPNARWELLVPNGSYRVRVVAGDASHFDSVFRLSVEGVLAVSGTPTSATRWLEGTVTVNVSDGRLTVSNGTGASNNKICFIEVGPP
jgi:glucose/arabinose dehydrogenase/PKD repeat protein